MDWTRDPAEITALIDRYRADQRALAEIIADATAVIDRCHALITADATEIDLLTAEQRHKPNRQTPRDRVDTPA